VTALTQRVKVGSYYTNGTELFRVEEVHALGSLTLQNVATDGFREIGIDAFRRQMWLAADQSRETSE
jgi:hypothetical protein